MEDSSRGVPPEFTASPVSAHVTRIHGPYDVLMYLVTGRERALLVDTGYGVGDLAAFVASLTDLPLTVVLTHGHVDHAFGASQFADVRMHPADLPVLAAHQSKSRQVHADAVADGRAVFLAPKVDPSRLAPLSVGKHLELGGLTVTVLGAPGHTPGSVALLVQEERLLITGDAANQFTFLFLPESSTLTQYVDALRDLEARTAGAYDRVLVSHGRGEITPTVLDDLLALSRAVLAGGDDTVPFRFDGADARIARAVVRAAGDGPPADDTPNLVYDPRRL
ncbi:MBL fold metallo-hydrolase [Actinomyces sp.]|uniref:MBL fold metallo-hydrolase n=1 Tax=Actinomyces sp. TaxID=29317 RepID=UPI0026DC1C59|nr:MBL fold metallo-hydrolase [Actinomyces sp.]MDO4900507.1 MBL fold metallo-hydrolase [Actinomyces sp.]